MKESKIDLGTLKVLGYLGIFILLIFIILPPLFRVLFPEEDTTNEKQQLIVNLSCSKTEDFVEYKLNTKINTNYVDGVITDSTFTYEIDIVDDMITLDGIMIEEYEALKKVNNIDFEEIENKYILKIDYNKFDYSNEELLNSHRGVISSQMEIYSNNAYECKTTRVQ